MAINTFPLLQWNRARGSFHLLIQMPAQTTVDGLSDNVGKDQVNFTSDSAEQGKGGEEQKWSAQGR